MKMCCDCRSDKPESDFYAMANGNPAGVCKDCHKSRMKRRALTDPAVQEYDRIRAKNPERRALASRITVQWRKANPEAYKAHTAS
jgi:hypothetical protein